LYADDIVLLADSVPKLKQMLEIAAGYARKWQFRYNCSKSNVVVATSSNHLREAAKQEDWMLGSGRLQVTDEYKYLGIESGKSGPGRWKSYIKRITGQAWAVAEQILWSASGSRPLKPSTAVHLWKALARPILEYGDALWAGALTADGMKKIEKVQTRFAKGLLTLSRHAPAVFVRSELGLPSMASRGLAAALKFYGKLVRMPATRLASYVFRLRCDQVDGFQYDHFDPSTHQLGQYSWCTSIRKTLADNDCSEHWDRRFVPVNWGAVVKRLVNNYEVQLTRSAFAGKSTLQLYQSLPRSPGRPEQWMNRTLAHPGVRVKVMMRGNCAPCFRKSWCNTCL
jgi:hypothetical protein